MWEKWPKRRPSTSPREEEKRCNKEANEGPDIATFCRERSSMAAPNKTPAGGGEQEKVEGEI